MAKVLMCEVFNGTPAKENDCMAEVETRWSGHQCSRKRGYGPSNMLCGPHARQAEKYGCELIKKGE